MIYSQIATVLKRSPKYNIPSRQRFKFVGLSLTNNIVFKSFSLFIRKRVFLMVYFEIVKNPRVIRSEKNGKGNLFKKTLTLFIIPLLRTKMPNIWEGTPPLPPINCMKCSYETTFGIQVRERPCLSLPTDLHMVDRLPMHVLMTYLYNHVKDFVTIKQCRSAWETFKTSILIYPNLWIFKQGGWTHTSRWIV